MSTVLAWGSSLGYTETIAASIQRRLASVIEASFDIADEPIERLLAADNWILGVPTWKRGELQTDWNACVERISAHDLRDKRISLFGLSDGVLFPECFQDAMGIVHDRLTAAGALVIGHWPSEGYRFSGSRALTDDGSHFVGLALDEVNESEHTNDRVAAWTERLWPLLRRKTELADGTPLSVGQAQPV